MKTPLTVLSTLLLLNPVSQATPSGFLESESLLVRADSHVNLDWGIIVPVVQVADLVDVDQEEQEIEAKTDLVAEVRVLGAALGRSNRPLFARALARSTGSFEQIFSGFANGTGAASSQPFVVPAGESLNFRFITWDHSGPGIPVENWVRRTPVVETGQEDERIFILKDGDEVPTFNAAFDQEGIAAFVAPYLTEDGTRLKIGPSDLMIFAELNPTVTATADFQDFVVLVSFTES